MREQSIDLSVWIITCEHCEQSFGSCTQNLGMYVHLFLQGSPPLFAFPPAPIVYRYLRPWRLLVNLSRETQQTQIDWATQAPEVMQHVKIVFCKHENILSVELQLRRHVRTGRWSWRSVLRQAQPQMSKSNRFRISGMMIKGGCEYWSSCWWHVPCFLMWRKDERRCQNMTWWIWSLCENDKSLYTRLRPTCMTREWLMKITLPGCT
jgi:hypothetical protein